MYPRSNPRVPPIPGQGLSQHDLLLQHQLAQHQIAQHHQMQMLSQHGPQLHPAHRQQQMELDAAYALHIHQQHQAAMAQQAQFQAQHQGHPGLHHHTQRHAAGHSAQDFALMAQSFQAQAQAQAQGQPAISATSGYGGGAQSGVGGYPGSADPLYSMISAEHQIRERERNLYSRQKTESANVQAGLNAQSIRNPPLGQVTQERPQTHLPPPSTPYNQIFKDHHQQVRPPNLHRRTPTQTLVTPGSQAKAAAHYPLDLSSAPSKINVENYQPIRVVAPSVQRELDRQKAEKDRKRREHHSSLNTSLPKAKAPSAEYVRPRTASTSKTPPKLVQNQIPTKVLEVNPEPVKPISVQSAPFNPLPVKPTPVEPEPKLRPDQEPVSLSDPSLLAINTSSQEQSLSKDIIRTHDDFIRCQQERQLKAPHQPLHNSKDVLTKIYEMALADKVSQNNSSMPSCGQHYPTALTKMVEGKLPLLTKAIRESDKLLPTTPKNNAETLENLKQKIFKNWGKGHHSQKSQIFRETKRPGTPIDDNIARKRSKSTEVKPGVIPIVKEEPEFCNAPTICLPKVDQVKVEEVVCHPGPSTHTPDEIKREPTEDTSVLDDFESEDSDRPKETPKLGRRPREENPQLKIYKKIKREPLPPNVKKLSCKLSSGETLLHVAGRRGYSENIAYYLHMGLDVNARDHAGFTPLHEAVTKGHLISVKLLLEQGANPNEQSKDGTRPIHDASENGDLNILRMLLSFGADPTLTSYSGESALELAEEMSETKSFLKEYLEYIRNGNDNDELEVLFDHRDIDLVDEFLQNELNPSSIPDDDEILASNFKIEISDNPMPESYWLTINDKTENFILVRDVKTRLDPEKNKPVRLTLDELIRQVKGSALVHLPDDLPNEVELLPLNNETTNLIGSKFWSRACA